MTKILRYATVCVLALVFAFVLAFAGCSSDETDEDNPALPDTSEEPSDDTEEPGEGYKPEEKAVYTVTFDLNYVGGTSFTVSVEEGGTVSVPENPVRPEDFVFSTWYTDVSCSEGSEYDFSTPVTADMTLYAGWIDISSADDDSDLITITYMWNYDDMGVYMTRTYESGDRVGSLYTAEREGYMLMGWFEEPECINRYVGGTTVRITESITLYALWYKGYTFEAENTCLLDSEGDLREFRGYSQNTNAICSDSSASGGYYIGNMYINECFIYFEITSDSDIDDAEMYLSLAMMYGFEHYDLDKRDGSTDGHLTFTDSDYTITVNGSKISYKDITFNVSGLGANDITAFEEIYINSIALQEGLNIIRLEVSNSLGGQGGTQFASAPLVDYMKIYSNTSLTMTQYDNIYV